MRGPESFALCPLEDIYFSEYHVIVYIGASIRELRAMNGRQDAHTAVAEARLRVCFCYPITRRLTNKSFCEIRCAILTSYPSDK